MRKTSLIINNKIGNFPMILAILIFVGLSARIGFLSLSKKIDDIDIQKFAKTRTTKEDPLYASRGTIYDGNGNILAQDVSSYTLIAYLDPKRSENSKTLQHVENKELTARELSKVIDIDYETILKYLSKEGVYQTEFGVKGKGLNQITKDKITALKLPGIDFISTNKRYYPYGDFASYLVGYAKVNDDGKYKGELGIEKYFDKLLTGVDGYTIYQKDRTGYKIAGTNSITKDAVNGNDIHLTIDNNVQFFVDEAIKKTSNYKYDSMSIVVANAKDGRILAYSTTPSFDPNKRDIKNYLDSNSSIPYEPGSVMKTYTYMAALEAGVYKGSDTYKSGTFTAKDKTVIKDWNNVGWGWITFDKGYIYSSNIAVVNIMDKYMDAKTLKKYFIKLGFGTKTGVFETDINGTDYSLEQGGKIDFKYETEIFNASFGQGITTTPLQHIKALTSIANDGELLKPYIVSKVVDEKGNIVLENKRESLGTVASQKTIDYMKNLMWHNVNDKDGAGHAYAISGYDIIGKTGTAQIPMENGKGYERGEDAYNRSITLMYPKDNPEIIIYGVVKRSAKADPLAKAVKEIIINTSKYYNIYDNNKNNSKEDLDHVNNYINEDKEDVIKELKEKGITYITFGNGNKIVNQYPIDSKVTKETKVFLLTNDSNYQMINIMGYSRNEVNTLCNLLELKCKINGNGYVIKQSIPEGKSLIENNNLEVDLDLLFKEKEEEIKKEE
ncbi:MAG: penicillin-binding protein [Bacilli bacterium]|nr:penicillin-binding protein [Bacilli bacterium]